MSILIIKDKLIRIKIKMILLISIVNNSQYLKKLWLIIILNQMIKSKLSKIQQICTNV